MKESLFILLFFLAPTTLTAQKAYERDFGSFFEKHGVDGCFVLFDESENTYIRYNSAWCDSGYLPASTFKIPHALIVLEEGIVQDTGQVIPWDGHEWPVVSWNQDQTLKTAIKYSCVWAFTGFAEKINIERYYSYVNAFDYGNRNLSGPPTRFWLVGQFRISANGQVAFLRKFCHYNLPVAGRSIDLVKAMLVLERTDKYILSGKTGGGMLSDTEYIMWHVGYLERDGKLFYYALNFKSDDFNRTSRARFQIAKEILIDLKLVD